MKPSIIFLKRFTESAEQEYLTAKMQATAEVEQKYAQRKAKLQAILDKKADKLPPKATDEQKKKRTKSLKRCIETSEKTGEK